MAGLYIHIPFCESRCIYCGFYSTTSLKMREAYVDALCKEMAMRTVDRALGEPAQIETIYLGGGTPSQLTSQQLLQIFEGISQHYGSCMVRDMEVTMECNPDDITSSLCHTLSQLPVNRISMGAQTFSDERLRFLHRRHNAREVENAIHLLREAGIGNISIDLMFGFPNETIQEWQQDIEHAISLNAEHLSAYSLMYEEGTTMYRLLQQEKIKETDEDTYLRMYEMLIDKMTAAGYEHYEISNFAKPGFRSRHNSSYWHEVPYIGLGAAAHSYRRKPEVMRSWNEADIHKYIQTITEGRTEQEHEILNKETRYNDLITTALRTIDGITLEDIKKEFGDSFYQTLMTEADKHIARQLMVIKDGHLALTRKGLYISDDIMSDFMLV